MMASFFQSLDSLINWINHYPLDLSTTLPKPTEIIHWKWFELSNITAEVTICSYMNVLGQLQV